MGRDRGTFVMPGNTELKQEAPYDARLVVERYSDLTNPETWKDENGRVWLYDGMVVSVLESSSRGLYILTDKTKYTSSSSWRYSVVADYEGIGFSTTGKLCLRIDQLYSKHNFLTIGSGGLMLNVGTDSRNSLVYGGDRGLTFDVGQGLKISTNNNGEHYVELDANNLLLATNASPIYIDSWGFVQMNLGSGLYVDKTRLSLGTAGMLCLDTNIRESSGGSGSLLLTTLTSPIYADEDKNLRLSVGTGLSLRPSVDIYPAAIQLDVDDLNRRLSELELTTRTSSVYKDGNGFLRLRLSSGLEEYTDDPYGNTFLKIKLAKEDAALRFDENDGLRVNVNEVQKSLVLATGLAKDDANALYVNSQKALQLSTSLEWSNGLLTIAELAKRQVFDDMWIVAVGTYGSIDHSHTENGAEAPYQLYDLWLTYEEALKVYDAGVVYAAIANSFFRTKSILTHLPSSFQNTIVQGDYTFYSCKIIRKVFLPNLKPGVQTFYNCASLRSITVNCPISDKAALGTQTYLGCFALENIVVNSQTFVKNFSLKDSPLVSVDSFNEIISKKTAAGAMTITVHPDVYNKLVDEDNAEWHKLYTDAAEKEISFATTT